MASPLADVQHHLDELAEALNRDLSIDGPYGDLLAYSAQGASADPVRIESILRRKVAPEVLAWERRYNFENSSGFVEVPPNPELRMTRRNSIAVLHGGVRVGYLWILIPAEPLSAEEQASIRQFVGRVAEPLSLLLEPQEIDRSRLGEVFFGQLMGLEPPAITHDGVVRAMPALADGRAIVCSYRSDAPPLDESSTLGRSAIEKRLVRVLRNDRHYLGSMVTSDHGTILLVCPSPGQLDASKDAFSRILTDVLAPEGQQVSIAFSDPVAIETETIAEARVQTAKILRARAADSSIPRIATWREIGVYRLLLSADLSEAGSPLDALERSGEAGEAQIQTLETFLDLAGDVKRTSEALHLHRTSLYYRLNKISEALGVDLNNGIDRLDLHLALKMRRIKPTD